jgi:hypothetical protein
VAGMGDFFESPKCMLGPTFCPAVQWLENKYPLADDAYVLSVTLMGPGPRHRVLAECTDSQSGARLPVAWGSSFAVGWDAAAQARLAECKQTLLHAQAPHLCDHGSPNLPWPWHGSHHLPPPRRKELKTGSPRCC